MKIHHRLKLCCNTTAAASHYFHVIKLFVRYSINYRSVTLFYLPALEVQKTSHLLLFLRKFIFLFPKSKRHSTESDAVKTNAFFNTHKTSILRSRISVATNLAGMDGLVEGDWGG